jgi:hypothetical protein
MRTLSEIFGMDKKKEEKIFSPTTFIGTYPVPPTSYKIVGGLSTSTTTEMDTFSPYDFDTRHAYWDYYEYEFYEDYRKLWLQNGFAFLLIEYLINEILGDGTHFEGDGAEEVEDFFKLDGTDDKLEVVIRQTIMLGNGLLNLKGKGESTLISTSIIDAESIRMTKEKGKIKYTQSGQYLVDTKKDEPALNPENLIHFTIKTYPNTPYGMSLLRPNLHFLRALDDCFGDIPAALKRVAYAPMVMKLDLGGYATQAEKEKALQDQAKTLHKVLSATTNFTIDARHDLQLVSGTGRGALSLPVVELIQPLISVCLMNFGVPLGIYLQADTNKAVIREQRKGIRKFVRKIQKQISRKIEISLIPKITSKECQMVFNEDSDENLRLRRALITEYEIGLISKEYFLDVANINDVGTTFIEPSEMHRNQPSRKEYFGEESEDV